ncbi:MAG: hypothetical protein HUK20_06165 [Fibrobacter sp.]|nr:hypothetical protein [Fibrobacter sp.]
MKTIVINKSTHGIYANGHLLVPGTNCIEGLDSEASDIKSFVEQGELEIKDVSKLDDKAKAEIVEKTNTQTILEELGKMDAFKNVDTKKRKGKLDDYDKANEESSK